MKAFVRGHINITHHKDRGSVTIELTESAVLVGYLSSFVFLVSGLLAGCTIFRRQQQQRNVEACTCAKCKGQFRLRKELGAGGYGHAQLVTRQGKPFVLKMVGCDSINEANAALTEASCLQQLNHPNVVRFEDVFLHRHDSGGISVSILMEFCAGGDLIDRLECRADEKPLTELQVIRFLESLCYALHHVHNCGVLHRDLKSSNIFVTRYDREVKVRPNPPPRPPTPLSQMPPEPTFCGCHARLIEKLSSLGALTFPPLTSPPPLSS
jgi:serine/threonine protein kinase